MYLKSVSIKFYFSLHTPVMCFLFFDLFDPPLPFVSTRFMDVPLWNFKDSFETMTSI